MKQSENIFFSFGEKTENSLFSITLFRKNILGEKKDLHAWNRVLLLFTLFGFFSLCYTAEKKIWIFFNRCETESKKNNETIIFLRVEKKCQEKNKKDVLLGIFSFFKFSLFHTWWKRIMEHFFPTCVKVISKKEKQQWNISIFHFFPTPYHTGIFSFAWEKMLIT